MNITPTTPRIKTTPRMMTLPNEQFELDGLQKLDPQAIGAVYDRYFLDVYRYVRYRLSDERTAEDISSEVFVRLLEAVKAGRSPTTSLKAWLLATAAHMVADHFRKTYRRPTDDLSENLADGSSDPPTDLEQKERERRLKTALAALTEEQQHVITLRFNHGLSLEETAQFMKKNVNAIKQLQFRALAALNRKMGEVP